jgi:hypothetical protein
MRRAIAPTAPGCGTLGWVLDVECGRKGLLAGELNGMRAPTPPSEPEEGAHIQCRDVLSA